MGGKDYKAEAVIAEFRLRRRKLIRAVIVVGGLTGLIALLGWSGAAADTVVVLLLVVFFTAAVFINHKLWRCPSCNGHLGKLYPGLKEPRYCPVCGIRLIEQ